MCMYDNTTRTYLTQYQPSILMQCYCSSITPTPNANKLPLILAAIYAPLGNMSCTHIPETKAYNTWLQLNCIFDVMCRVAWLRMKVTPHIKKLQPNSKTKKEEARMNEQNVRHLYCNEHNQITCNTDFDKLCRRICADFVSWWGHKIACPYGQMFPQNSCNTLNSDFSARQHMVYTVRVHKKIGIRKRTMKLALRIEAKKRCN